MLIRAVDLFCGTGGFSHALIQACKAKGHKLNLTAVNHWSTAINSHSLNHPGVRHICEPVENLKPAQIIPQRHLNVLLLAAECTFHSNARGGGPCNEQSRSQAWSGVHWCTEITVDDLVMENVREFLKWGPLYPCTCGTKNPKKHRKGSKCLTPIPERKGEYFRSFVTTLKSLGRSVDWREQVAADYGDPTSRVRLILISRSNNRPIVWPKQTHMDRELLATLPRKERKKFKPHNPAEDCIDFSIPGRSVFKEDGTFRHCDNTMDRIRAGITKFWGTQATAFLALLRGTGKDQIDSSVYSLDKPFTTITGGGRHHLLVQPSFLIGQQSGARPRHVCKPMPTVAAAGAIRLVQPIIVQTDQTGGNGSYARSIKKPLGTVVSKQNMLLVEPKAFLYHATHQAKHRKDHARRCHSIKEPMPTVTGARRGEIYLCEPFLTKYYGTGIAKSLKDPIDTITTKDRFLLVEGSNTPILGRLDVVTRLLGPDELKLCHSFPKQFILTGTKEDQTKQVGNSVPVKLGQAHVAAVLP